jgi:hypothetical protein
MKKEYIIGGLALVGGIALVAYLLKPKAPRRNSEGFFGANGKRTISRGTSGSCRTCYSDYSPYNESQSLYFALNGYCRQGDICKERLKTISQA